MSTRMLSVTQAQQLLAQGYRLIDIRSADEFRREHIAGAENITPSELAQHDLQQAQVIFTCLSGMRTQSCADQLAQATGSEEVMLLDGGLNAWKKAQGEVVKNTAAPLPLMRQVQIVAGSLIVLGVVLGYAVHAGFFLLAGLVGAGLVFAGVTGFCGMAVLLMKMPWNKNSGHTGTSCSL